MYYGGIGFLIFSATEAYQSADYNVFGLILFVVFLLVIAFGKMPFRPFFPIYFDEDHLYLFPFLWQKIQIDWKDIEKIEQYNRFDTIVIETKHKKHRMSFLINSAHLETELNNHYKKKLRKQKPIEFEETDVPTSSKKKVKQKDIIEVNDYSHLDLSQDIYQKDGVYRMKRNTLIPDDDFDFKYYTKVFLDLVLENTLELFVLDEDDDATMGVIVCHMNQKLYISVAFLENDIFETELGAFMRIYPNENLDDLTKNEKIICLQAEENYNLRSATKILIK